jgi:hypothetical protein
MEKKNFQKIYSTNDFLIRSVLRGILEKKREQYRAQGHKVEIFDELGVKHGANRIDYAIVNGIMCGFEIKSDRDTLDRLPEQVKEFGEVFDELTLVVGKKHLYHAIHQIPDWWGVWLAKEDGNGLVGIQEIRGPQKNKHQDIKSIARLLWKEEALRILEERNEAKGLRNKSREIIYTKIQDVFAAELDIFKKKVSLTLTSREGWRAD